MGFLLKGIPKEISEYIELPDMAELLTYPIFYDCDVDSVYKYGTEFQKKLLDMTPLRGGYKYTTILSEVRLVTPYHRSVTTFGPTLQNESDKEWHIDTIETDDPGTVNYKDVTDTVHLLTSKNTCMTEFLKENVYLEHFDPETNSRDDLFDYIRANKEILNIHPVTMPHNRIVTFTNHAHRAKDPKTIEFRYMYRIVETNRLRPPSKTEYDRNYITTIVDPNGDEIKNVAQYDDKITIFLPKSIQNSKYYRPKTNNHNIELCDLTISNAYFDNNLNIVLEVEEYKKDELEEFVNYFDTEIMLFEEFREDNTFRLPIKFEKEVDNKAIFKIHINQETASYFNKSNYLISFNVDPHIKLINPKNIKLKYNGE